MLVGVNHLHLVEQVAHVLSVQGGHRITCMEHRLCLITCGFHPHPPNLITPVLDGEQGNGSVNGVQKGNKAMGLSVVSKRCCSQNISSLVCDHFQCVAHLMPSGRSGPSHPARLLGVDQNVNADLATSKLELVKNTIVVVGLLHVAKTLQHIPQQAGKSWAVQSVGGQ
jgi:hypothetical protein